MRAFWIVLTVGSLSAAILSYCGKKKEDEAEAPTVAPDALMIPINTKCGDKPCIN